MACASLPRISLIKTGDRIEQLRKKNGLSVKQLAMILGFNSTQSIYKWQRGDALPTLEHLLILSIVFDVPIDSIVVTE
ncbi:MAG: helix-turn-helix transcriptional regulator [Clostridia bacterium]|nr:helix-turn-helix transcriptional regulator [Clostridia bacterium]